MTVAICIAGMAHTPLATHPRVASPHDSPSAEGGGVLHSRLFTFTVLLIPTRTRHAPCTVYGVIVPTGPHAPAKFLR
jgi:hypothetical protein